MKNTLHFNEMVQKLRHFFQVQKKFIEVPAQSRTSILAACEDPQTITQYTLGDTRYPLPQTGQMWLEYELLKNPEWPGVFCVTTSYRDEPNPIPGRHLRIFPMFEFEAPGTFEDLKKLEAELVTFLGFEAPISIDYTSTAQGYETEILEAIHETALEKKYGAAISLESFPACTDPFWNMKRSDSGLACKVDILLHGMETIGSAERETDVAAMRERFLTIKKGTYADLLISQFGKQRVLQELEEYLALPMIKRFGGGIGLTRLARAMELSDLFEMHKIYSYTVSTTRELSL